MGKEPEGLGKAIQRTVMTCVGLGWEQWAWETRKADVLEEVCRSG